MMSNSLCQCILNYNPVDIQHLLELMTTQPRTRTKMERIKQTALDLFAAHGLDKVSMDEIAAKAGVSKVTIYKYFGSKEQLYAEVINLFGEKTLAATAEILNSDLEFLDKLKAVLALQIDSAEWVDADYLFQMWDDDAQHGIQKRVRALMQEFFEQGQRDGYIHMDISFDTLDLYADIFRTGMRARLQGAPVDAETLEALYRLYFFGFINQKRA